MRSNHVSICVLTICWLTCTFPAQAVDCNGNGVEDQLDLQPTLDFGVGVLYATTVLPFNFYIGDVTGDGKRELAVSTLNQGRVVVLHNQFAPGFSADCNDNDIPDECDVASGSSFDVDQNGIPDECDPPGDLDDDGDVDLADLATLLATYSLCVGDPGYDPAGDVDGNGCVDLADLATLLSQYGFAT